MRDILLLLVALYEQMKSDRASAEALHEIAALVDSVKRLLRARGQLCSCHPDCLDESFAPSSD